MKNFFLCTIKKGNCKAFISFFLVLIFFSFSILFVIHKVVTASESNIRTKRVTSVRIEAGDSLWSIAKKYITPEYVNINQYIKEIKASNGLTSDIIHENQYIIVPYYDF